MSIGIFEDHVELGATLRKWAATLGGCDQARAQEGDAHATFAEAWSATQEMGLTTIGLPEGLGGGGGSVLDVAVALEACAHELVPGALLGPAVAGLLLGATEHAGLLADGAVVGLALDGVLWDAPQATHVLLEAAPDRWVLAPRDAAEITVTAPGLDLTRRFGTVRLHDAAAAATVRDLDTGRVRRAAVTLGAAEASGIARWCLATAVDYAGVREQFGRKIGSFQAVKHLCAEMLEHAEAITSVAWDAANAAQGDDDAQWSYAAEVAAVVAFDAAVEVAKSCIQVLGGIGFTFEHDAHFYFRRAQTLRGLLGSPDAAAARLAARAVDGERRRLAVDLDGRDEPLRPEVRASAERIAALPEAERRAALVETGFLTPHWPAPYGLGADAVQQLVIDQELARAGIERPDLVIAGWAVPTILEHGTDEQRARFVPPSLMGELVWCQLFSEPGAGSDLASLRTRAVRVEGGWRLTGQKVWTSGAQSADWGICLARTDPDAPQHRGITYFLVDMRSAGIEVRPLREMTGDALFNEVFLDDVFVPDECVVAQPGDGWRLARTTLANERVAMASSRLGKSTERAVELAAGGLRESEMVQVGRAVALATVCSLLGVRTVMRTLAGRGPGPESSVAKLLGVRSRQDGAELVVSLQSARLAVPDDQLRADLWEMLSTRCLSIAGGTTQILRNVAGERILGLPR